MERIITDDYTISVPSQWRDATIQCWTAPHTSMEPIPPNVTIAKETLPADANLQEYVSQQLKRLLNHTIVELDIEKQVDTEWQGKPAIEVLISQDHGVWLKQRQLYIRVNPERLLVLSFTASEADFHNQQAVFDQIAQTLSIA